MSGSASSQSPAAEVLQWIKDHERVLVVAHERPDGDAIASVTGMLCILRSLAVEASGYLPQPMPKRYQGILPVFPELSLTAPQPDAPWDGIICLDTTGIDRLAVPSSVTIDSYLPADVCTIDHHMDNSRFGACVWVDAEMSATAQMLYFLAATAGLMTPQLATCLTLGMVTDTGGFRFPNTSSTVLRTVAALCDEGADYDAIMDAVFFRTPYARRLLEARLTLSAEFAYDQRLMYAVIRPELLERLNVSVEDTEGIIDVLRTVDGVDITCLVQPEGDAVRLSLRGRSHETPVVDIARQLGGGGHTLAAGVRLEKTSVERAKQKLIKLAGTVLHNDRSEDSR